MWILFWIAAIGLGLIYSIWFTLYSEEGLRVLQHESRLFLVVVSAVPLLFFSLGVSMRLVFEDDETREMIRLFAAIFGYGAIILTLFACEDE